MLFTGSRPEKHPPDGGTTHASLFLFLIMFLSFSPPPSISLSLSPSRSPSLSLSLSLRKRPSCKSPPLVLLLALPLFCCYDFSQVRSSHLASPSHSFSALLKGFSPTPQHTTSLSHPPTHAFSLSLSLALSLTFSLTPSDSTAGRPSEAHNLNPQQRG